MSAYEIQSSQDAYDWANAHAISPDQIEPTFFQQAWKPVALAVPRTLALASRTVNRAVASFPAMYDYAAGTNYADYVFKALDENYVEQLTPDPRTIGTAGHVLGGLTEGVTQLAAGGGSPTVMMALQGNEAADTAVKQGASVKAAYGVGAVNAAAGYAGVKLPFLGSTLTSKVLSGIGGNVALGAATRGATGAILAADGQPALAEPYHAFGGKDVLLDAVLGGAFGLHAHFAAPGVLPSHVDATLTLNNAKHYQSDTAPGVPADINATVAHQDAMELALKQTLQGEPVNVGQTGVQNADFVPREAPPPPEIPPEYQQTAAPVRELPPELQAIPADTTLTAADKAIETRFRETIQRDPEAAMEAYSKLPDTAGGKVLNTDIARELSPEYLKDRTKSAAVHEPASALVKAIYAQKLREEPKPGELPLVVFSAGGTGAGKTTGLDLTGVGKKAQIVYDSNMNSMDSSIKRINQALEAGKDVQILYTYREPVEALTGGALPRAASQKNKFGSGRTVPIKEHAKTHIGSSEVVRALAEHYANDPRVTITVVDNSRGKGKAVLSELSVVPKVNQAHNELEAKLHEAIDQQFKSGRISEDIYRGFKGESLQQRVPDQSRSPGVSEPAGAVGGQEPQSASTGAKVDPIVAAARQLVDTSEINIPTGELNADGSPEIMSAREMMNQSDLDVQHAANDAKGFEAAVTCFLARGVA